MNLLEQLNELTQRAHQNSRSKGFWEDREQLIRIGEQSGMEDFATKAVKGLALALEHSEISEGLHGIRKDLQDDHLPDFTMEEAEAADTIIRIMDRAAGFKLRLWESVFAKMNYNEGRQYLHGGKAF